MIGELWGVLVVCLGAAGGEPCQTHHFGPFDGYSCPRAVAALKVELATTHGQCLAVPPAGSTPLPATTGGAIHAAAEPPQGSACGADANITGHLRDKWHEEPAWAGLSLQGMLVQLWQNGETTWTLVVTAPSGRSCIMDAGKNSFNLAPAPGARINLDQ